MRANLPNKDFFLGKRIPNRLSLEIVEFIKSGNNAHVFRGHDHELRLDFACKIHTTFVALVFASLCVTHRPFCEECVKVMKLIFSVGREIICAESL